MKSFAFFREYKNAIFASALIILFFVLRNYFAGFTGEENRYASVAWQMYQEHNWLVPKLGSALYPDKPPLTYWLTILGWNLKLSWQWPLIIPALFTVGIFFLAQKITKLLFPAKILLQQIAPILLLGMPYFVMHYGLVRFDMQLTFFNLVACYALLSSHRSPRLKWILFAFANTLGVLAKGPVVYLFTVPEMVAFALAYQANNRKQFLLRYALAVLLSLVLCLLWVVPVLVQMGWAYSHSLIFEQIFLRVSSGHVGGSKPFWHYLPVLGLMLFPWILFKNFWQAKTQEFKKTNQFLLISIITPIIILSIIVSKQERYLLPLAPLLAIYLATCFGGVIRCGSDRSLNDISVQNDLGKKNVFFSKGIFVSGGLLCVLGILVFFATQYVRHLNLLYKLYFPRELGLIVAVFGMCFFIIFKLNFYKQIFSIAVLTFLSVACLQMGYLYAVAQVRNLLPIAEHIQILQNKGVSVVSTDPLVGEMQYMVKLSRPVDVIAFSGGSSGAWKKQNPEGWVLFTEESSAVKRSLLRRPRSESSCYSHDYLRGKRVMYLCPVTALDIN